jgi:hypothetical protein
VRHLLVGELHQAGDRNGTAKRYELRGVQTTAPATPRVVDAAGGLVADHHRAEQILSRRTRALANG